MVILTDETGAPQGVVDQQAAHRGHGKLHCAFSVFVFRKGRSELLIQKRAVGKLLFAGLWGNTCCSHPRPGEDIVQAAEKRLLEECGFRCTLTKGPSFVYRAEDPRGRGSEYEYDTILTGNVEDVLLEPNPEEIADLRWMKVSDLLAEMEKHPDHYALWLREGLRILLEQR